MTDISTQPHAAPWTLHVGDARAVLSGMLDGSADCIVTSPPYWGKRDYGTPGQYGHEDSPADISPDFARLAAGRLADEAAERTEESR